MNELELSVAIEDLLVARNLRGMKTVQAALQPGYIARAATLFAEARGTVLIGTGFPVENTFETDGPVGAIALYEALSKRGCSPVMVCGRPISDALEENYRVHRISVGPRGNRDQEAREALQSFAPDLVISIERPGLSAEGRYANMRGEDISDRCACFDTFVEQADCPTIAIGDGGNEVGMGKVGHALRALDIVPAITGCDELLVADVSNWAAYGLLAMIGSREHVDYLAAVSPGEILDWLSARGSVDGVTRENTPTEDGLPADVGIDLIQSLQSLTGFGEST